MAHGMMTRKIKWTNIKYSVVILKDNEFKKSAKVKWSSTRRLIKYMGHIQSMHLGDFNPRSENCAFAFHCHPTKFF
jgi:hypothetical protein